MGYLEQSVEIYERLRRKTFQITIENEMVFLLRFLPEYYHHLAGFQHLRDFSDLAQPGNGARGVYRNVKKGRISEEKLHQSVHFHEMEARLQYFAKIEEILCSGQTKIIVSYDPNKAFSKIDADFLLYQREGYFATATYYGLFLRSRGETLLPITYVVEHSQRYVANQRILDCEIEILNRTS